MVVYLVILRPYTEPLSMALSLINEFMLIVILGVVSNFVDPLLPSAKQAELGRTCMGLTITLIAINWACIIGYSVYRYR